VKVLCMAMFHFTNEAFLFFLSPAREFQFVYISPSEPPTQIKLPYSTYSHSKTINPFSRNIRRTSTHNHIIISQNAALPPHPPLRLPPRHINIRIPRPCPRRRSRRPC